MYVRATSPRLSRGKSTPATRAIFAPSQPWRWLCRGFLQMTRTTPDRRTILQFSQRTLTDGRTFTTLLPTLFEPICDPAASEVLRPVLGHRDRVLKVRRQAPVHGHRGPSILEDPHLPAAHRDHRLDREHHAGLELRPPSRLAEVRHLRVLVQIAADPVPDELSDDREAVRLDMLLDGVRDVRQPAARPARGDGTGEAVAGNVEELPHPRGHLADREGQGAVRIVPLDDAAEIEPDDVPLLDPPAWRGNPVHHLVVDRHADGGRKAAVALERRRRATGADEVLDLLVDLLGRQTGFDPRREPLRHLGQDVAGRAHQGELARGLQQDHAGRPTRFRIARPTAATSPSPETVDSRWRSR